MGTEHWYSKLYKQESGRYHRFSILNLLGQTWTLVLVKVRMADSRFKNVGKVTSGIITKLSKHVKNYQRGM